MRAVRDLLEASDAVMPNALQSSKRAIAGQHLLDRRYAPNG